MESFQELGLPAFLGESLKRMNFSKPTPVQAQAIPAALLGKDVIASAQTGTGKTAAFGIPLLNFLENHKDQTALILTPTRELAMQVLDVLRKLTGTHFMGGSVLLIGGANMGTQLSALTRKPRLFIGTPGRVIDHLQRGSLNLANTGFLVLDEADRMLDMGFAPQLEEIRKRLAPKRQTLLFSATIPSNIRDMGSRYLKDPVRITVGETTQPIAKINQMVIHTSEPKKPEELVNELNERQGSVLLFARTQNRVDRIAERLKEQGFKVTRIHGGRSQSQRRQAIEHFREGHYRVLVATDIAARGLDIHHIAHVINYDLPRNPEDYIHRVGRTARAGAEGSSLCFLTQEDRDLWNRILKLMGAPKDSIQVKASKFGNFTPKTSHAPHPGHRPASSHGERPAHKPEHRRGGHRDQQRGPKPFTSSRSFEGQSGHTKPSGFAKPFVAAPVSAERPAHSPSRSFDNPQPRPFENTRKEHVRTSHDRPHQDTGSRPPFKREGGFEKRRHPEGRHQKRSNDHARRQGFSGGERTPFNTPPPFAKPSHDKPESQPIPFDDEKQPADNRSSWGSQSLQGAQDRPFVPRTNRPQRPGFRPGGDRRPHRPGVMTSHSGERPFSSERRPGGGDRRPHRADHGRGPGGSPGGRPGFSKNSRPEGPFKKREFRPRTH